MGSGTVPALLWGCTQGCSLSYRSDIPRPRVVFLADGNGPFIAVAGGVHAEDSRHVAHIEHLEPVYQLFFSLLSRDLLALRKNVVHIECEDDEASLVLVDVYA